MQARPLPPQEEPEARQFWEPRQVGDSEMIACVKWQVSGTCALGGKCTYSHDVKGSPPKVRLEEAEKPWAPAEYPTIWAT